MAELPNTLLGLRRTLAQGSLSVPEALQAQRQRVRELDAVYGCVVSIPDEPQPDPTHQAPLAGVGLAHKDIFDTDGHRPGLGHDLGGPAPERCHAHALQRLRGAGASHLARLAMAEHACGATGANPRWRPCVNPRHVGAVVGGSSSGSAVAVASGMAYGSLGTDTAGSVRIPAAACGVLGLKTTHGLVSCEGVAPLAPSLDSVGLLARSADDAAALLHTVAGRPLSARPATGLRVKAWLPPHLSAGVGAAIEAFVSAHPGAEVVSQLPEHGRLTQLAEALMHAEAAQVHHAALLQREASAAVEAVALPGLVIAPAWADAVRRQRAAQLSAFVAAHLQDHDLLLLPAFAQPVPDWAQVTPGNAAFDARRLLDLYAHMGFVNYLGLPALVFPIASDERGLPISVQAVARPHEDATLLAWAASHEQRLYGAHGIPTPHPSTV